MNKVNKMLFYLITYLYLFTPKLCLSAEKELSYQNCYEGIVTGAQSNVLCNEIDAKKLFKKLKSSFLQGNTKSEIYLERLVSIRPFDLEPRLTLARFFVGKDNIEKASSHIRILSKIYRNDTEVTLVSADFKIKLGLIDEALNHISQTIKSQGPNLQLLQKLAELLEKKGAYAEASDVLLKARKFKETLIHNDLSSEKLQIKNGETQNIIYLLEAKLEEKQKVTEYYDVLGDAYLKLGNLKMASNRYRKATLLSPNDLSLRIKLAKTLIELGQLDEARLQLSYVIITDRNNAVAVYQLTRIHLIEKNYALAGKLLQRWQYDHPQDVWVARSRARLWAHLSEPNLATNLAKEYKFDLADRKSTQKNVRQINSLPGTNPTFKNNIKSCVFHLVKPDDNLTLIAKQHFGDAKKWNIIFDANKDKLTNPNHIQIGWELKIPKNSESCKEHYI